ncbi:MAG: HIT family protein [Candidatus Binatia bacterium]
MSTAPDWFVTKFKLAELAVVRHAHWTLSIRPSQPTLGACVLSLNRPCEAWGDTTPEENAELAVVISDLECRLNACFGYDKINYLMLMMVDPHVHFHVIPRYAQRKERYGLEWIDAAWPKPPDLSAGAVDAAVLDQIRHDVSSA